VPPSAIQTAATGVCTASKRRKASLKTSAGPSLERAGTATVRLERAFAALIRTDDYHVFVTAEAECGGLYVAARGRHGFTVREPGNGRSSAPFS
jgi:hypothetical protein